MDDDLLEDDAADDDPYADLPACAEYAKGTPDFEFPEFGRVANALESPRIDETKSCIATVAGVTAMLECDIPSHPLLTFKIRWNETANPDPIVDGQRLRAYGFTFENYGTGLVWIFDENGGTVAFQLMEDTYLGALTLVVDGIERAFDWSTEPACVVVSDEVPGDVELTLKGTADGHPFSVTKPNGRAVTSDGVLEVNVVDAHIELYESDNCGDKAANYQKENCAFGRYFVQITEAS
ncbi:hypothetical protein K8I61_18810 [bacterium]|nr:hypothetical protein [bacterium]